MEKSTIKLTVIIPAYNEESVISDAIRPYEKFVISDSVRLIVVCNSCTDRTFEVASSFSFAEVYNEKKRGKIHAINCGVEKANNSNIFVQDADTKISEDDLSRLINFVESDDFALAAPVPEYNKSQSFLVRKYYEFFYLTPAYKKGMVGAGSYLINRNFVHNVFPLPNVLSDDGYVKFKLHGLKFDKILNVSIAISQPNDIWSLIKIKTRSRLGNLELSRIVNIDVKEHRNQKNGLIKIALENRVFFAAIIYFVVNLVARSRAVFQFGSKITEWERDESTR